MDPTVGEGSGPSRAGSPNGMQAFCPTGAAPWSLGIRAQKCLGCDGQELRGHCRAGEACYSQKGSSQRHEWLWHPQIFLGTGQKQVGIPGPHGRKDTSHQSSISYWFLTSGVARSKLIAPQKAALLRARKPGSMCGISYLRLRSCISGSDILS